MNETHTIAYTAPFRAVWLRRQDLIEVRFRPASPADERVKLEIDAIVANFRLLGVQVPDNKRLGIGRWLRRNYAGAPHTAGDPTPPGEIVYDSAAQMAYFSLWPRLGTDESESTLLPRKAEIDLDSDGNLTRIRIHVLGRRRREDELAAAVGFLPER